ncbi:MAG: efflux RND transporter permease subunit [Alphaproteobacteria bacterium]
MDIAKFSIKNPLLTWLVILILVLGGIVSFNNLSRLEDPEFTIKEALVYTNYPGASAIEVEQEVTDRLETAIQELGQLDEIKSKSVPGRSEITVSIKDQYGKDTLPQIWDELRRKVGDAQGKLPPGAGPSSVIDDFGDVYGIYYALTGDGFSDRELYEFGKFLRKELLLVDDVAKIVLGGVQQEYVYIEISNTKLAQLGIPPQAFYDALASQNLVAPAGSVRVADEQIRINPSGTFTSIEAIGNLVIKHPLSDKLIYLKDVATVKRGTQEIPSSIVRFNGKPSITMGISGTSGSNIVDVGARLDQRIAELQHDIPAGFEIHSIYHQPTYVDESVRNFLVNLLEAVAIVIVVLMLFMGLRSGLIIGSGLLITIMGTFIFMDMMDISLQRISLGALIIALGMLVDNPIVVADGILVKTRQGLDSLKAASTIVSQNFWPLLGATVVGITAFAPIGLSDDSTGEYCGSLFYVILISLLLSWYLAVAITPYFCDRYLPKIKKSAADKDEYDTPFYRMYSGWLTSAISNSKVTMSAMVVMLACSIYGFSFVKQSFFPDGTTPMFYVDYWAPQGSDIRATRDAMKKVEDYVMQLPETTKVTSVVGQGAARFMLTYAPEQPNPSYGQFLVEVKSYQDIAKTSEAIDTYIRDNFAAAEPKIKYVMLGPSNDAKIEARFMGSDPTVLRELSDKAQGIMLNIGNAINVRDDWRQKVKTINPIFSEARAQRSGVTRREMIDALLFTFSGKKIGVYRENDELLPIVIRSPDNERLDAASIEAAQVWSPFAGRTVPLQQVVDRFDVSFEDQLVRRRDRKRTITASCDPANGTAAALFKTLRPQVEAIELPAGYELEWGGEYESSTNAQAALATQLPMGLLIMVLTVVIMFNALRQPLIIWLTVPLAVIGVTFGLLATNQPFGFMALLGMLSLSGMLIKNAIVLIDQIDLEIKSGKDPYQSVVDSAISRVRPVSLAAITTILGMIPLLQDAFFVSMAITIMAGLAFATVLTLIVVPVLYTMFFNIKQGKAA